MSNRYCVCGHPEIDRGLVRLHLGLLLAWFSFLAALVVTGVYPV